MARALVSFAIPCREAGPYLRPLLESLMRQTCQDFDILLVDDDSRDDSVAIAAELGGDRIRIERNTEPLGLGGNWNRCAEFVDTELFCLAHVDDVYEPNYLASMIDALQQHPEAAFAHCRAQAVDEQGSVIDSPVERFKNGFWSSSSAPDPEQQFHLLRRGNYIMCPSVLYRTDRFRAIGPFDPKLRATLDWERHVRTTLAGHSLIAVPKILMGYRRHVQQITNVNLRTLDRYREEARILRWIDEQGRERGWLDGSEPPSQALRNNLLYDVFVDLRQGDNASAKTRLDFARTEERRLAWGLSSRIVAGCARLGVVGRALLGTGLQLVLWITAARYFIGSRRRNTTTSRTNRK